MVRFGSNAGANFGHHEQAFAEVPRGLADFLRDVCRVKYTKRSRPSTQEGTRPRRPAPRGGSKAALYCVLLVVVNLAVFWQVCGYDYIDYDDTPYVIDNPQVHAGPYREQYCVGV